MDKLIAHISSGVGKKRAKRKSASSNRSVLIRLGSSRASDDLLPDYDDDSDDEEYQPPVK